MDSDPKAVAEILLDLREPPGEWNGRQEKLQDWPSSKQKANMWFVCCLLDYQMRAWRAWENGVRLVDEVLGNPDELWKHICSMQQDKWVGLCREHSIHRFPKACERIWTIGQRILKEHGGDVRNVWNGLPANQVLDRLLALGVGSQLSRMVVGGLRDTKLVTGATDVKADIHVRRVLGRSVDGDMCSPDRALELARKMSPKDPWMIDGPVWTIGYQYCFSNDPDCEDCPLGGVCAYSKEYAVEPEDEPTPKRSKPSEPSPSRRRSTESQPRKLLPKMQVTLTCEVCGDLVAEFDVNAPSLASKLTAARREHAHRKHAFED